MTPPPESPLEQSLLTKSLPTPLPLSWVRRQFPALTRTDATYLDNAAGAQVPQHVLDNVLDAMSTMQVNKGGAYAQSRRITEAKERVRAETADFLNARPEQVAFGPNATTLLELLAQTVGRTLQPGDEVIVTDLDHHANKDPWRRLTDRGAVIRTWATEGLHHTLTLDGLAAVLTERTRVVAMTAASNALGTLTPVPGAAALAHEAGAWLVADAVHYAPHFLPDVRAWGVDALVFSPYKVFGPHLGALYLADGLRETLSGPGLAFFPKADPIVWEPGTQNHEAIHGFGGVFAYLRALADEMGLEGDDRTRYEHLFAAFARHEQALLARLLAGLEEVGATYYGLPGVEGRTATVSFNLPGLSARRAAEHLGVAGVAVACGHYYAYDLMMENLGLAGRGGAVRASLLHYNEPADVDALLAALAGLA